MSTLRIREFQIAPLVSGVSLQVWPEPGTDQTPVTVSGTSAQSAAFDGKTKYVAITCDGIFSYVVGSNPTATANHFRVPADQIICFSVQPGDKIAAITNT